MHSQQNLVFVIDVCQGVNHGFNLKGRWAIAIGPKCNQPPGEGPLVKPGLWPPYQLGLRPLRLQVSCIQLGELGGPPQARLFPMSATSCSVLGKRLHHCPHPGVMSLPSEAFRHFRPSQQYIGKLVEGGVALKAQSQCRMSDQVTNRLRFFCQRLNGRVQQLRCRTQFVTPTRRPL